MARDMMTGGICIIITSKVVAITGPVPRMLWHVFLHPMVLSGSFSGITTL